jgi:hypothetical protein
VVTQLTEIPERFLTGPRPTEEEVEIHADDAPVVALFFALGTQWHRHPFSGLRTGLDYSAVRPMADLAGIDITPTTLPALQAMEHAALETFAEAAR